MLPDALLSLADSEKIFCRFVKLPKPFLGLYDVRHGERPLILLHKPIQSNRRLLRCILAEEMGHHFTSAGNLLAFARSDKAAIALKQEQIALWWAVQYLVPLKSFIKSINSGLFLTWELAEYFNVTERFMGTALRLYLVKRQDELIRRLKKMPVELQTHDCY